MKAYYQDDAVTLCHHVNEIAPNLGKICGRDLHEANLTSSSN